MGHIHRVHLEPRSVYPQLSSELGVLAQSLGRDIFLDNGLGLCYNAPLNLFGSLFLLREQSKLVETIQNAGFTPSDELLTPVTLTNDLPISDTDMRTGTVVFKRACGPMEVGFVTTGPLSGLMVSEMIGSGSSPNSVIPMRVFNDEVIPRDPTYYHPYAPRFLIEQKAALYNLDNVAPGKMKELLTELIGSFKLSYSLYVEELRKKAKNTQDSLFVSTMLFDICEREGIPLEPDKFHYTRDTDTP